MIADVMKKELEKYQARLDELLAQRDAEIEKKCDILRAELKAVPNPEIEALEELIAGLQKFIEKESEINKEEKPADTTEADVSNEEPKVEETIEEEPVEAPVETQETPAPQTKQEPAVEEPKLFIKQKLVIDTPKETPSIFARMRQEAEAKKPVDPPKQEKVIKVEKVEKAEKTGRTGMTGIFNPKRR